MQLAFLAFRQDDLAVAHHPGVPDMVSVGAVVDEHRQIDAYLSGSQAHALGRIHGGEHIPYKLQQLVVELSNGTSGPVQDRISPADDRQDGAAGPQIVHSAGLRWHAGEATAWRAWNARSAV